jgi:uroporphyrinogen-III synthase
LSRYPFKHLTQVISVITDDIWWIAFFAPSSSQFAYPFLQKHFRFTSISKDDLSPTLPASTSTSTQLPTARVAAIGRVTSTYLEEELKICVDVIATKPSPEALADVISSAIH